MAPELHDPEKYGLEYGNPTKESDVYSFSMIMWEVCRTILFTWLSAADIICKLFTGRYPFHESRLDAQVTNKVLSGKRPPRLESAKSLGLSDEVWQIMERCWKEDRRKRPRISSALQDLKRAFYFTDQSIPIPKHLTFDIPPIREKEKPKVTLGVIDQTLKITLKPIPIASKLHCPSTK